MQHFPYWSAFRTLHNQTSNHSEEVLEISPIEDISLREVSFSYNTSRTSPVWRIDLNWSSRESLGLIGPNGVGKTTLALLLLGLVEPVNGAISVTQANGDDPHRIIPGSIGYLAQRNYFDELDTIRSAVHFVAPDALTKKLPHS